MTDPADSDPDVNQALWFTVNYDCPGRHYLIGNPHTFAGRMHAWCPKTQRRQCVSANEILDASPEARAWVAGFLAGNEPRPPVNDEGDVDFESREYAAWSERTIAFRRTGHWDEPFAAEDPASPNETAGISAWTVWRQDDNGNQFTVSSGHPRAEAERICQEFEQRGHKQTFWIAPD